MMRKKDKLKKEKICQNYRRNTRNLKESVQRLKIQEGQKFKHPSQNLNNYKESIE